jgi:hypothetical protein
MKDIGKVLGQILEFHESGDCADEDDVRISWNIDIKRGKDQQLVKTSGIVTMPGFVSDSQVHLSPERISDELISKIVIPTAHKFQDLANKRALDLTAPAPAPVGISETPQSTRTTGFALPDHDEVAVEAEIISGAQAP